MPSMRQLIRIVEGLEPQQLDEAARAPFYHATSLSGAISILTSGSLIPTADGRTIITNDKHAICVTRDERYRYSGAGSQDEDANPVVEAGHGPVQFVIDADVLRQRFGVVPHDMASERFATSAKNQDRHDPYGGWDKSGNLRRKESEERILVPKGKHLSLDGIVKAVILEPITKDWLRFRHHPNDQEHLVGSGNEKRFKFATPGDRYDNMDPINSQEGLDFTGVQPAAYHRIMSLAKRRGIPVIDRRAGK